MALQPRKIGESKAQYSRRVGSKNPPRTVGRPQTNNSKKPRRQVGMRVPTKATQKLVPKSKPVTVTGKKPPIQKVKAKVDPDRRRPIVKKPTKRLPKGKPTDAAIDYFNKDGKRIIKSVQPTRRTPRPNRQKSFQDLMKEIAKRQPKRPPRPPKNEVGLPPKRPIAIRPGLTDPKGKPIPKPPAQQVLQPPPSFLMQKPDILKNKKYIDLNQKELLTLQKQKYEIDARKQKYFADQQRQAINKRYANDPVRLKQSLDMLDRGIRINDTVSKFKAGMVGVDAVKKLGLPAGTIDQLMFDRKMLLTPDSPAKYDAILKRRLFQANRNYREQYKRMVRQGASSQEILRMKRIFRDNTRSMRESLEREKLRATQRQQYRDALKQRGSVRGTALPKIGSLGPKAFASIFGPR